MKVRITGGELRGRMVRTVPTLRPATEKVRKAVFDILGPLVDGANFLELFAGSGAVGIEALSRGASHATFVEHDRKHANLIQSNLEDLDLTEVATLRPVKVEDFLGRPNPKFDIVFAGPWYKDVINISTWHSLLSPEGILVFEHLEKSPAPENEHLRIVNHKTYGDTALTFYTPK